MVFWTLFTFFGFTAAVGILTWYFTRKSDHASRDGFFLAGRSLTYPLIAGSLLLTNLSTEQMVGLNGAAFTDGLCVMAWEVVAVVGLVLMALFFLPRFLKSGVTTVPQYLAIRFDRQTELATNLIFLAAYTLILLPIILYTGATGMMGVLDLKSLLGIESPTVALWLIVIAVGVIGSIYALWGGLTSVAFSDTLNGVGLLIGGFMITYFSLDVLGDGSILDGIARIRRESGPDMLNSIGGPHSSVPFGTLFTGVLLVNVFYWCTNQQIIQRTFGAKSLGEGQKGVLLCALLKLIGPFYLVLPGIIAAVMFAGKGLKSDHAYGALVNAVLPGPFAGFFAAVLLGAILSSFNSALNSSCTLFSLGIYKPLVKPEATDAELVRSGRNFGWIIATLAVIGAPFLANTGGIFSYLQKMNGLYAVPILAVVIIGMTAPRVSAAAAKWTLTGGVTVIALGYFVPPFATLAGRINEYHFLGLVFAAMIAAMLVWGKVAGRPTSFVQIDVKATDMTPFAALWPCAIALLVIVGTIYTAFAR